MSATTDIEDQVWRIVAAHDVCDMLLGVSLVIGRLGFIREAMDLAVMGDAIARAAVRHRLAEISSAEADLSREAEERRTP